jgi:uncharacterized caspase-like protein
MRRLFACLVALCTLFPIGFVSILDAQPQEKRIALVVGNAAYEAGALKTSANDAGLIAQTLQAAGFDVVGARDLDQDALRRALRDFLGKAASSGPDTVAFVYLSGYGLQLDGENYFLPVDATIRRADDVAAQALRVADYIRPLATLKLKASIVVLDAARRSPFTISGGPLAGGLAPVAPSPGTLIAFNAAPGTVAPVEDGPYGAYAQALAEMMRDGGLPLPQVFERARLRASDLTKGADLPWFAAKLDTGFVFFERAPDAPPPVAQAGAGVNIADLSIRELPVADAYAAAVARDTVPAYEDFLAAYPDDPLARRVRAILAARREAITWQESYAADAPNAYWSYLRRYPHGPHSADARRRLALRAWALEPPASFDPIDYDVPPPPPDEQAYVDRPVLSFDDADYGLVPPPPVPVAYLPPPPPEFVVLPPPYPVVDEYVLPVPVFVPLPVWCDLPAYVVPPPDNVIFTNVHNTIIVNRETNFVTIRNRHGEVVAPEQRGLPPRTAEASPHGAGTPRLAGLGLAASLPPSLAQRRGFAHPMDQAGASAGAQHARTLPGTLPLGQPLPGMHGQPLPSLPGRPGVSSAFAAVPPATAGNPNAPHPPLGHQAPSLPATSSRTGTLGQPLPGTHGQPLPPLPGGTGVAPATASPWQHGPAHAATTPTHAPPSPWSGPSPWSNSAARTPSATAAVHPPSVPSIAPPGPAALAVPRPPSPPPVAAYHPPSIPAAPYRPSPPPVVHAAPPAAFQPPMPTVHAAPPPPPAFHPPAPAMHMAPPPTAAFHPPAPLVHAAPPPAAVFHPPAPAVRAAPAAPAAVGRAPTPFPGRKG